MSYFLQTNHLTKTIGGKTLVKEVSLHIRKGEIYGFLGPNGAGKTTVMKMLTNLWKPTSGTIEMFGETLTPQSYEVLKRMGSIIEFPTFYEHLTGYENLKLHCEYMGYYQHGSIENALELLDLTDAAAKPVKNYSLGMKERLGIANDPDTGVPDAAPGNEAISPTIELFTSMSFLVFTGVMLASFIVNAYKNKTMNLMFSYPIKRQKILISQMLAVWIFNFTALVLTKLLIYGGILANSRFLESAFPIDYDMASSGFYIQLLLKAVVVVTMGFIALFVGMAMKSSKATIITSFLLIFLTQANIGDLTMAGSRILPMILTTVSLVFAFLSVYRAEEKDLI